MEIKCEKTFLRHTKEISYHTILFFFLASSQYHLPLLVIIKKNNVYIS